MTITWVFYLALNCTRVLCSGIAPPWPLNKPFHTTFLNSNNDSRTHEHKATPESLRVLRLTSTVTVCSRYRSVPPSNDCTKTKPALRTL